MTPERWKKIEAVFEQVLELTPDQRPAFLESSCDGDEELRREVESLLDSHAHAGSFIDQRSLFLATAEVDGDDAIVASGELIGAYRVVCELGRGGMGAVYLAERADGQYQKRVAIKLIKRGMDTDAVLRRFRNERQILASFDHSNIARLFDAGTTTTGLPYFVMEYIEGVPIDNYCSAHSLSISERLKLFREVCTAVAYAHGRSVIHRDIKCSNILVTKDGVPKLLDFGITKLLQKEAETLVTMTGQRLMTPEYASPEQLRGERATAASDVYSLGVVLYQLLAGTSPYRFKSDTPREMERAILEDEPVRPSTAIGLKRIQHSASSAQKILKGDLDNIVLMALRKEPERRYQSVEQFSEDIQQYMEGRPIVARPTLPPARVWRWSRRNPILAGAASVCFVLALAVVWLLREQFNASKTAVPDKSIAVLPFENLSADKAEAYLADGIQEEILTGLSKIADLKVISRTSAQCYRSSTKNLPDIGRQLGVAHVLEGSLEKAGDQVRVHVQLIKTDSDSHLWAEKYDRNLSEIFAVESEIATKIVQTLQAKLTGSEQERIAARQTQDTGAHELYLKGRFFFDKRTPHDLQKAIEFFKQALAKDPNYAVAYAGIADVYALVPGYAGGSVKEAIANARAAAEKALAIDNDLAEAHSALALSLAADFDLQAARREFERAIELNPNYAAAHYALGFSVLGPLGQFDAAIAEMKRAVDLDPLSVTLNGNLAYCYIFARRYPEAIAASDKAIELDARNPKGQDVRAMGLELSGRVTEAIAQYQRSFEASGGDYHSLWFLSRLYGLRGERAKALQTFEKAKQIQQKQGVEFAYGYAVMNIGLGNYDEAIKWLERSYESKEAVVPTCYMIADPLLDPLRGDPRFEKLAKQIASELNAIRSPIKTTDEKSVAVLPFEYLSTDKSDAYLADGIQEELLTRLSKIADLKVISRTSTQRYKDPARDVREIARQLGVAHVVEGTVQKAGDQVRVNVQLINAQTDAHLWADKFDRKLTDIFAVETEVATKIADSLQAKLTGAEQRAIATRPTENSEAHELYLRGRFYWNNPFAPGFEKSREYYQQAIQLDPTYALAYAGLADYYGFAFANGLLPPEEKWAKAEEDNAKKALELDPTLGEAYNPLAAVKLYYYRDWPGAERDFRRGLELSPNFAEMHAHYAFCLVLFGRNEEAFVEMRRALELDPLSTRFGFVSGRLFFFNRQYDVAIDRYRKTLELDPNFPPAHESLGYAYEKKQMQAEAIAEWSKALTLSGESEQAGLLEHTYSVSGFEPAVRALAQKKLERLNAKAGSGEYVPALDYAIAYIRMGDKEQAFAWLTKAIAERNRLAFEIKIDPMFDPLRGDPRFETLVQKIFTNKE